MKRYTIAVMGSHSALDVCRGAKDEDFRTLVIAQKGRDNTYSQYYKTKGKFGCVDEVLLVDDFEDILKEDIQKILLKKNCIFIPHRSFEVYVNDYDKIEREFRVPIFGNKFLLKCEERGVKPNQYDLLDIAKIRFPKQFKNPKDIDRLVLVKVLEKERGFERSFFLVENYHQYEILSKEKISKDEITKVQLDKAVIEEFILGVQVNFNFFYSQIHNRLELIGTDTRRQTNIEGLLKIPAGYQELFSQKITLKYEEAGHIAVTVLESLLEDAFSIGERFVESCKKMKVPIIGPFGLQTMIIPGPPKKEIVVFDVSPRMPGSPGIFATPYSGYLYGQNMSMGRRVAMEIKEAIKKGKLKNILT